MQSQASFFNENLKKHESQLIEKILSLTKEEQTKLDKMLEKISSASTPAKREAISEHFQDADQLKIFKFCEKSPEFKRFFQRDDLPHCKTWANDLKQGGFPSHKLATVSGKEVSVYNIYLAAALFAEYETVTKSKLIDSEAEAKHSNPLLASYWLDEACKLNLFQALVTRCRLNKAKLSDTENIVTIMEKIFEDAAKLGDCYSSAGYLHAAELIFDCGAYYQVKALGFEKEKTKILEENKDSPEKIDATYLEQLDQKIVMNQSLGSKFLLPAAKNFFCAKALDDLQKEEILQQGKLINPRLICDQELLNLLSIDSETGRKGLEVFEKNWGMNLAQKEKELLESNDSKIKEVYQAAIKQINNFVNPPSQSASLKK